MNASRWLFGGPHSLLKAAGDWPCTSLLFHYPRSLSQRMLMLVSRPGLRSLCCAALNRISWGGGVILTTKVLGQAGWGVAGRTRCRGASSRLATTPRTAGQALPAAHNETLSPQAEMRRLGACLFLYESSPVSLRSPCPCLHISLTRAPLLWAPGRHGRPRGH